jgi:hypothetical protein
MIGPVTSWFEIVELPTGSKLNVPTMGKGKKVTCNDHTNESESLISHLHKSVSVT